MVSATILASILAVSGSSDVTLLSFTADWCGACQAVKPTVQRLAASGFPIREVNVDREAELVTNFRVTSVPCFVLVKDGREVERVAEATSYARLVQMFDRAGTRPTELASATGANTQLIRGQSGERGAGIGLPRPLASLARNFGQRPKPEERLVEIDRGPPAAVAIPASAPPTNLSGPTGSSSQRPSVPSPPAAAPSPNQDERHRHALQATVRLRVDDLKGHSIGTGTIIDTHGSESLIVTCGHLFRDSSGRGRIAVDLFADPQPRTVNGTLISYDLEHDLGLVAIPTPTRLTPARVAAPGFPFERGQAVFSIGCDRGADPTVRPTRITGIDRYVGTPNLEIAGEPTEGRSGGGLFSSAGELIGVCNAADPSDNEGIFASLPAIHWELDRIGQRRIFAPMETELAQPTSRPTDPSLAKVRDNIPAALPQEPPRPALAIQAATPMQSSDDTEVICIVRSRANPQGTEQLLILDRPSRDLLDRLSTESRGRPLPGLVQQPTPRLAPARTIPSSGTVPMDSPNAPQVIRAQSNDR